LTENANNRRRLPREKVARLISPSNGEVEQHSSALPSVRSTIDHQSYLNRGEDYTENKKTNKPMTKKIVIIEKPLLLDPITPKRYLDVSKRLAFQRR
jgi:hypothetical protein